MHAADVKNSTVKDELFSYKTELKNIVTIACHTILGMGYLVKHDGQMVSETDLQQGNQVRVLAWAFEGNIHGQDVHSSASQPTKLCILLRLSNWYKLQRRAYILNAATGMKCGRSCYNWEQ
jgi:hypothetical protein